MIDLIKSSKVKAFALHVSKTNRAGKFTRVSKEFLERIDSSLKRLIHDEIHRHPSVGKTLK